MINTPEYVSYDEYERVCRTCGEYGQLLSIYERNDNLTYADMVMECSSIKINLNDGFPEKICLNCVALVRQCYAFKQQCKQLDNFFHYNKSKALEVQTSKVVESKVENELLIEELDKNAALDTPEDMDRIIEISSTSEIDIVKEELQYPDSVVNPQKSCVLPERLICPTCGKSLKSAYMKIHMLTHTGEKPYTCNICGKGFTRSLYLKNHMVMHSDDTPHLCSTCGKAFKRIDTLKEHLMIHTGERPHLCIYCGKRFRVRRHMIAHRNIHTKEQSCKCNICGNQYTQSGSLRQHYIRDHDVTEQPSQRQGKLRSTGPFKCDRCDKQYKRRQNLQRHILGFHRRGKKFSCIDCGKAFTTKLGLDHHSRQHIIPHTGEKSYICIICNRKFAQKIHLNRHLSAMHGSGVPHQCDICEKYFPLAEKLRQHRQIHTVEKRFVCPVCNKGFYDSSSLKKHRRTHIKKSIPNEK